MTQPTPFKLRDDDGRPPNGRHPDARQEPEPYIASEELVTAMNLAIYLRRPLLLEGEAGCGKSRLAYHVSYELGLPFYDWPVKSTSRAREGLYEYDSILRLHDVHLQQSFFKSLWARMETTGGRHPAKSMDYVTLGALGKAFSVQGCPAVVLIDEIDKADIDFPNDLLTVLDKPWNFRITEAGGRSITAEKPPIVIITSNKEKGKLSDPFLRRCVYFYINFPDEKDLKKIVDAHYQADAKRKAPDKDLVTVACECFLKVRGRGDLYKKPGTSEFLDWLEALRHFREIGRVVDELRGELRKENPRLPYPELLFKLKDDWKHHAAAAS